MSDETMTEREFECIKQLVNFARQDNATKSSVRNLMKHAGYSEDEVKAALSKINSLPST